MFKLRSCARIYLNTVKERWEELQLAPTIFAYDLRVMESRYLQGEYYFYAELNPQRMELRRPPQPILTLNPVFCEDKFNFNKIDPLEHLLSVTFERVEINIIVNKSPLCQFHSLICPELSAGHPQRLTLVSLHFAVELIHHSADKAFRVGYNSPGALASVNHLHLHLLYLDFDIYIDRARLEPLGNSFVYRLHADMPTEAICMIIYNTDSDAEIEMKLKELYRFVQWLCENKRPHNLFITQDRSGTADGATKIFIFARKDFATVKNLQACNIGFCELSGYVAVGNKHLYDNLNEEFIIDKIRAETGTVYAEIYQYFLQPKEN